MHRQSSRRVSRLKEILKHGFLFDQKSGVARSEIIVELELSIGGMRIGLPSHSLEDSAGAEMRPSAFRFIGKPFEEFVDVRVLFVVLEKLFKDMGLNIAEGWSIKGEAHYWE